MNILKVEPNTARGHTIWPPAETSPANHVVMGSDWEAESCRAAEANYQVLAYTKNHNLGFEVPYRFAATNRRCLPDFIVLIDDGMGIEDPPRTSWWKSKASGARTPKTNTAPCKPTGYPARTTWAPTASRRGEKAGVTGVTGGHRGCDGFCDGENGPSMPFRALRGLIYLFISIGHKKSKKNQAYNAKPKSP